MKIEYFGHSCFRIISNKGTCVVTDPYEGVGYDLPQGVLTDIVTVSHAHFDHNNVHALRGARIVITKPERYVFDDVIIEGFVCNHDENEGKLRGKNVVFTLQTDGIKICHLGDLGERCSKTLLEKIGKPDVILIPVGGTYTIDALQAKEYVDAIQPKIVIPMHYKPKDGALDITDEKPFLTLFDAVIATPKNEAIDVRDYVIDGTRILFMERKENA
ncbi:MAG: MBL fold metallo-hydrolase [Clostridiales bacterium]|nr:MBL fold metallo-hydrolase [Clostridiales bacterium]